ncbi:TrkA C-terminal domain-containing protein [Paenibacillus solisilvae]|uniref:TrkA C-terminal domain-containing protein n=1 Tax=Paenibacillus solisilvae TaxID=2486751 RepID=A0ABW0VSY4_9BACL
MGFIIIYIVIVLAVVEISVVLMRATGLDKDISRFQVVSLLTSTGFTTKESELISDHPLRRRIGMFLILFGVFSFAVIVSAIANILAPGFRLSYMAVSACSLIAILLIVRTPVMTSYLSSKFNRSMERSFDVHELPIKDVLLLEESDHFAEVPVGPDSAYIGQKMSEVLPSDADLNLLYIKRGTVNVRKEKHDTALEAGDVLYLYGNRHDFDVLFAGEIPDKTSESANKGRK